MERRRCEATYITEPVSPLPKRKKGTLFKTRHKKLCPPPKETGASQSSMYFLGVQPTAALKYLPKNEALGKLSKSPTCCTV